MSNIDRKAAREYLKHCGLDKWSNDHIDADTDMVVYNVPETAKEPRPDNKPFRDWWCQQLNLKEFPTVCMSTDKHINKDGTPADAQEVVGAHVRIRGSVCSDQQAWIVPLCKHCNHEGNTDPIHLVPGTKLVPIVMAKPHPGGRG